jgi:hypothetical protein
LYEYVQNASDVLARLDLPKTRHATRDRLSHVDLGDVTMDVPVTTQLTAAKLPWVPPVVKQVPIVSHTKNLAGITFFDGGVFDDTGSHS